MPFASSKTECITFLAEETTLDFFRICGPYCFSLSLVQSDKHNTRSDLGNVQGDQMNLLEAMLDFPGMWSNRRVYDQVSCQVHCAQYSQLSLTM